MSPPTISIVTPSYNQARYLEETIRSVLGQAYLKLEYFVMDGGSTDESVDIIRLYESQLTGWVSEKDRGQAEAINKGFARCTGDIVSWINSDDFYLPGAFQAAIQAFEQHPQAGLIYGDVLSVDADSQPFNIQRFRPYSLTDLMSFNIISQPAVFMKRSVLEKAGYLDLQYHLLLDHHLWLRMARLAPMVYIPKTLAAARYHSDAKNLARTADFGREAHQIAEWLENEPPFAAGFASTRKQVWAGAHRLNGFYLLDGGDYSSSLKAYWNAFRLYPPVVLKELHRVLFALLAPLGLAWLREVYSRLRSKWKKVN